MNYILLPTAVFVPLFGSGFLPFIGRASHRLRNATAFILLLVPFAALACLSPAAFSGAPPGMRAALPLGLSFGLMADGLAVFMALISSFLGLIIAAYSFGYVANDENQNEYWMMFVLFIGAMMGITLSSDLIFLYVFWEISAICCWRLVGFYREGEYVRRANKALLITGCGALVMLGGFLMVYARYGTTDLTLLKGREIANAAAALIMIGIFSKSATLPLHSWLADAGVAPSPVTALLHAAVLVKIGVYVFARLFVVNFAFDGAWHTIVPAVAAASSLLTAGAAIVENDIKRVVAYSTVSQIGFIFLGLSAGGETALAGGLAYILMHAISKAGLFLCAGVVEHNCHTKDIRAMGGLAKTMPLTAASFFLCAFSVIGAPPFGGFFAKYLVIGGALEAGSPLFAAAFLLCAVLTVIYLLRLFAKVFLGEAREGHTPREGGALMVFSVVLLAALSLAGGLFIRYPAGLIHSIIMQTAEAAR